MKKLSLLLFTLLSLQSMEAQRFVGSVIFGGNASQVDGDQVAGYKKVGFNVGGSLTIALDRRQRWFATLELLYTQKGAYQTATGSQPIRPVDSIDLWKIDDNFGFSPTTKFRLRLDYAEIPILFHYEDPRSGFAFGAGFAWARLVYAKEIENGYRLRSTVQSPDFWYKRNDWSALADVKIRLYKGLKLNFRFQYSFVPIRTRVFCKYDGDDKPLPGTEWTRQQYHNVLTLRLIYAINEKYVRNPDHNTADKKQLRWMRDYDAIIYKQE